MKNYQEVARELMVVERAAWWNPRVRRILKAAPLVVMFLLLNSRTARAACSFNPAPDPTVDGSSNSLRHAVRAANASGQNCLIQLQAGTYTLTIKNTSGQDNTAAQGDLDITASGHTLTIQGKGAGVSIVNGNGIDRVLQVLGGANAVFAKLTIEGGVAQDNGTAGTLSGTTVSEGGGVLVQDGGHVTFSQVSLTGNRAIGGSGRSGTASAPNGTPGEAARGGGLFISAGAVDLSDSRVLGNAASAGTGGRGLIVHCATSGCATHTATPGIGGAGGASAGGGLYVLAGHLGLLRSTVSSNNAAGATGGNGGGFTGPLIDDCFKIGGKGGAAQGAALFISAGDLRLSDMTVSSNSATGGDGGLGGCRPTGGATGGSALGAGIFLLSGNIHLTNSTLFANTGNGGSGGASRFSGRGLGGDAEGGGLYLSRGSIALAGTTLASNRMLIRYQISNPGSSFGGGIANAGAGLFSSTTVIGNNTLAYANCSDCSVSASNGYDVHGPITSSNSLISQPAGAAITDDGGNIFNVNPALDPGGLRANGGPTQTIALVEGSPAIDTGDNSICSAAMPTGLGNIDQRGLPRFRHGDELCDIGAFEFVTLLVQPFQPGSLSFGAEPVGHRTPAQTVTVTNNQTSSVTLSNSIGGTAPLDFVITGSTCGGSLASHASCTISIAFRPKATGTRSAVLTVSDSPDPTSPYKRTLTSAGK